MNDFRGYIQIMLLEEKKSRFFPPRYPWVFSGPSMFWKTKKRLVRHTRQQGLEIDDFPFFFFFYILSDGFLALRQIFRFSRDYFSYLERMLKKKKKYIFYFPFRRNYFDDNYVSVSIPLTGIGRVFFEVTFFFFF